MSYRDTIERLCKAGQNPAATIRDTQKKTGKNLVGCFPIHTPEEIVYAADCVPIGMWGGRTEIRLADRYLQSFCCSMMRADMEYALKGTYNLLRAVIIPTFCDTLKCVSENMKLAMPQVPVIILSYPQHRDLRAGMEYAVSELERVRHELELVLGKIITEEAMEEAFCVYENYRSAMRAFTDAAAMHPEIITPTKRHRIIKAGQFMDKADYTEDILEITEGLQAEPPSGFQGTRVILTGLISEPVEILELFEENNIAVVGDDLSLGSRLWRTSMEAEGAVFERMARMVAYQEGDTFLYDPEKKKGQMLIDMVREREADAVVVWMMKFCDPEEYDYPVYKKELADAGIPELYLEVDQQMDSFEQMRTRIQGFAEMLL